MRSRECTEFFLQTLKYNPVPGETVPLSTFPNVSRHSCDHFLHSSHEATAIPIRHTVDVCTVSTHSSSSRTQIVATVPLN
jgi:hypothetical protein